MERERRVMGLVAAGGLATTVKADPLLTWTVPQSWSLQEAATVPVVYATVRTFMTLQCLDYILFYTFAKAVARGLIGTLTCKAMRYVCSLPITRYFTFQAYYALVVRGGLREGETVLIHAGSGGVGQAAISIALARSCTVYTTVSSAQKRAVLQKRFPQVNKINYER